MALINKSGLKAYSKFDSERVLNVLSGPPSSNADLYDLLSCCQIVVATHVCLSSYIRYRSGVSWPFHLTVYIEAQEPTSI